MVAPYDGASTYTFDGLSIPGRGMDWSLSMTYRSDVNDDGPLGHAPPIHFDHFPVSDFRMCFPSLERIFLFVSGAPSAGDGASIEARTG